MRVLRLAAAVLALLAARPAAAGSEWLESGRLAVAEIETLCAQVIELRLLARMQMIAAGDARWRRLSREALVIESASMGVPPLDPGRCYLLARAGGGEETAYRAFEVRDFAINAARISVFLLGRDHDAPPGLAPRPGPM